MTNKYIKDYCKNCDVEPPAMRFKCPECEHNTDNENIFARDTNVSSKEQTNDLFKNSDKNFNENYTHNKEQIIIDGVDVSECVHYEDLSCTAFRDSCGYPLDCKDFFFCNYKQLARKTQEYESLKQEIEILQNNFDTATRDCNEIVAELENECEQLKKANLHIDTNRQCKGKKLKRIEELISDCEAGYTDEFIQKIYGIIQEPEPTINDYSITDRYRKALEEIEEYIKKNECDNCECLVLGCMDCGTPGDILDIINRAKGS